MHTNIFSATGQPVSQIGLGTWQLGGAEWGDVPDEQALATLGAAADCGVTFIDTADIYGLGRSEQLIGRFLKERGDRERFFIATKLGRHPQPGWPQNFTPATIAKHTEDSLTRLGVERIDLTQTHCIPADVMRDGEVFGALADLVKQGKLRTFGASVESVEEGLACLEVPGLSALQVIFNVFRQKPLDKLLPLARQRGVAIIVRLPLASGLLSGRWTAEKAFGEKDHRNFNRDGAKFNVGETFAGLPLQRGLELIEQLRPLVPTGMTMSQFALRWCLDHPEVTTVIPGATRPEQTRQNAAAADFPPLDAELHKQLRRWYGDEVAGHIRGKY